MKSEDFKDLKHPFIPPSVSFSKPQTAGQLGRPAYSYAKSMEKKPR